MGDKTGIEWTDATWNPVRGCSRVSDGCRNCYAETVANRFKSPGQPYEGLIAKGGQWNGQITLVPDKLDQPLRWKRPRKIFVNSMSDLFHPNVPDEFIDEVFAVMALAPRHTFQILTKRPERMRDYRRSNKLITRNGVIIGPRNSSLLWPNVWLGVSVEDQITANERITYLMQTPAAVRWISAEPLLGPIDLGMNYPCDHKYYTCKDIGCWSGLDWVVVGGESATRKNARPLHPDWVRSVRDGCIRAGVPFTFKQWGSWQPNCPQYGDDGEDPWGDICMSDDGYIWPEGMQPSTDGEPWLFNFLGKKKAGNSLDGRTWLENPSHAR